MTRTHLSADTVVDAAMLYRMFDLDEDEPHHLLVQEARCQSPVLPQLVLSVLDAEGYALGTGARDELRRASDRVAVYAGLAKMICGSGQARVVKGLSIGARYPRGIRRSVGDLDLVVPDEPALWAAARQIVRTQPVCRMDIGVSSDNPRHCAVSLFWPAADPALDPRLKVDICTAAFCGDGRSMGIRSSLPADQMIADILSLAEERFQRPFGVKDFIDVFVLARAGDWDPAAVADAAVRYLLAPEMVELVELAKQYGDVGGFGEVARLVAPAAARERRRREAIGAGDSPYSGATWRYGYPLCETAWRERFAPAVQHEWEGGCVFRTPVGDYLLVAGETLTIEEHESAMSEMRRLEGSESGEDSA